MKNGFPAATTRDKSERAAVRFLIKRSPLARVNPSVRVTRIIYRPCIDSNCHTARSSASELRQFPVRGKRTLGINVPGDGLDLSGMSRSLRRFINLLLLCVRSGRAQ